MSFAPSGKSDRDAPARAALYRTRVLVNRTPHFSKRTRKEANRGLDLLESQLGRNQVSVSEAVRGMELLNRAPQLLAFGLLREPGIRRALRRRAAPAGAARHRAAAGRGARARSWPQPISGPTSGRRHRDELPAEQRFDAEGRPLPPPPGYY